MRNGAELAKHFLFRSHSWLLLLLLLTLVWITACASEPRLVDHGFKFDARWDSPDAEVLNYRYGNSIAPGARVPDYALRDGKINQSASISGAFPLEDSLYVKWRIKATGTIYEDTVDLKNRLPSDITGQRIYFIIEGAQLYVYLISLDPVRGYLSKEEYAAVKRDAVTPRQKRLAAYVQYKITLIYPDEPTTQETR
jgi:hypothetical protein